MKFKIKHVTSQNTALTVWNVILFNLLIVYIFSHYIDSHQLGKGGFSMVCEGRRQKDGIKVSKNKLNLI